MNCRMECSRAPQQWFHSAKKGLHRITRLCLWASGSAHHDPVMSPASMVSNGVVLALTSWHVVGVVTRNCVHSYVAQIQHIRWIAVVSCFGHVAIATDTSRLFCQQSLFVRVCVHVCVFVVSDSCEAPVGWQEEWQESILSIPEGQTLSPQETTPTPLTQPPRSDRLRQLFRHKPWNVTSVPLIPCEVTS